MKNEKEVEHDDTDAGAQENKNQPGIENSADGLDRLQGKGGQDGRNSRGIGSSDMDSKNGVLRLGDMNNSTMEITDEGLDNAVADQGKTNTAMVDVTTAGPDDYPSADRVAVPNAQEAAKKQPADEKKTDTNAQEDREEDVAETGTDLNNQPTY